MMVCLEVQFDGIAYWSYTTTRNMMQAVKGAA
jgi:hypothetical protein